MEQMEIDKFGPSWSRKHDLGGVEGGGLKVEEVARKESVSAVCSEGRLKIGIKIEDWTG